MQSLKKNVWSLLRATDYAQWTTFSIAKCHFSIRPKDLRRATISLLISSDYGKNNFGKQKIGHKIARFETKITSSVCSRQILVLKPKG